MDNIRSDHDQAIYMISHDLQAPVRALCAIPEWIKEDLQDAGTSLTTDVVGHFDLMQAQGARLQMMIQDLLTYSRIGRNQQPFDGNWDGLWHAIVQENPLLKGHNCTTDFNHKPNIGMTDMHRLLSALVGNAAKHHGTTNGQISVTSQAAKDGIEITVCDDGVGIPADDRDRVKQIFVTLKSRDTVEGSGMGLAIADRICANTGGTLTIGDTPSNVGCKVTAYLPN